MWRICYYSSAVHQLSDAQLLELLLTSRQANLKYQITGMLLYAEGNFFQILEGPKSNVRNLYHNITCDSRNFGQVKIVDEEVDRRLFPNWTMGSHSVLEADLKNIEAYTAFLSADESLLADKSQISKLIRNFIDACS